MSSSLTICDPDDIAKTVGKLRMQKVQVNSISLAASLYILEHVCKSTGGVHYLAYDQQHLASLLKRFLVPVSTQAGELSCDAATKIPVGFPKQVITDTPTTCACHGTTKYIHYYCPKC